MDETTLPLTADETHKLQRLCLPVIDKFYEHKPRPPLTQQRSEEMQVALRDYFKAKGLDYTIDVKLVMIEDQPSINVVFNGTTIIVLNV